MSRITSTTEPRKHRSKRKHPVFFELTDTADNRFDTIIMTLLGVLIAFAPLALGAVQAWSEWVVLCLACAMTLCLGLKLIGRPAVPFVWSWTYLPIALFLLLTALQLVPLPVSIVRIISPQTAELKISLLSRLPVQHQHLDRMTLSFYPEATLSSLRMLLAISMVYVVTLNTIRQSRQVRMLLSIITATGAGVAMIAFVHVCFGIHKMYGLIGPPAVSWLLAPFYNHNHFAQFMNLCLGAAIALLLAKLPEALVQIRRTAPPDDLLLRQVPSAIWLLAAAVVLMTVGVFYSISRGAMLSMVLAAGVTTLIAMRRGMRAYLWVMLPLVWIILLIVVSLSFNTLAARFASTADIQQQSIDGRIHIATDVLRNWKQIPILGMGVGAFEVVYPMMDSSNWTSLASHAENEYVQMLLEGGVIGLTLVVVFAAMIFSRVLRCVKSSPSPMASMAIGLGYGLLSAALQSLTDFGQHIPANAILSAVFCALLVNLAEASRRTTAVEAVARRSRPRARLIGIVVTCLIMAAVMVDGFTAARAERIWSDVYATDRSLASRDWQGDDSTYAAMLVAAMRAEQLRPGNIQYHHWLNCYRWKLITQVRDRDTGHVLLSEQQTAWANEIAVELISRMWRCPTFGPSWSQAGQILKFLDRPDAAELIRTGCMLSQTDPGANFEAGLLDARAGEMEAALKKFKHAAALSPDYLSEGVEALVTDLHREDLALQLAGEDVPAVRRIVELVEKSNEPAMTAAAEKRLTELITAHAARSDASAEAILAAAAMAAAQHDYDAAIAHYRRALQIDPTKAEWHLELARAYAAADKFEAAMDEARTANRLGSRKAGDFILDLRLKPATQ